MTEPRLMTDPAEIQRCIDDPRGPNMLWLNNGDGQWLGPYAVTEERRVDLNRPRRKVRRHDFEPVAVATRKQLNAGRVAATQQGWTL